MITISGSNALPTVTLTSATTYLEKGEPYEVTISLSEAMSSSLTIDLDLRRECQARIRLHIARRQRGRAGRPDVASGRNPHRHRQRGRVESGTHGLARHQFGVPDRARRTACR